MIRRIRCATRAPGATRAEFAAAWPDALAAAFEAPAGIRPLRLAANTVLPEAAASAPDGVEVVWFTDPAHAALHTAWQAARAARRDLEILAGPERPFLGQATVLRGEDWLTERWTDPAPRLKHLALATRAAGLTRAAFSARWKAHAGTLRSGVPIPPEARGLAYVQTHPAEDAPYDALTEVYFTTPEALSARIAWFATAPPPAPDLFATSVLLPARETLVPPP
ncbi:hypothetical protein GCM10022221_33440 [Actinocorallia aurea]